MVTSQDQILVLHVDDEPDFTGLVKEFLKHESDRFVVETATSADEGLKRLTDNPPDCIVSDYDMPGTDGIEFLEAVRADYAELPFILFTGKGSEAVAGDALKAGATDYIQKQSGMGQYRLLANRIKNAVEQYRSEESLRKMREEYAAVFNNAQNALILVEVEEGGFRYQQCNPQAVDLIGRDKAAIVGNTPQEALGPENATKVVRAYRKCVERHEPVTYTVTLDLPVGEVIRECEVTPVSSNGDIEQLVVEFRDITEQRQRQRELEEYGTIIKALTDAVYVLDEDGRFTYVNDEFVELVGYDRETILGNTPSLIKDEAAVQKAERQLGRLLSSDGPETVAFEVTLHPRNGDPIACEDHMGVLPYDGEEFNGSVGTLRDITDRKEYERRLEAKNERLEEFTSVVSHDLRNPLRMADGRLELVREECESDHIEAVAQALDRMDTLIEDLLTLTHEDNQVGEMEQVVLADHTEDCWQNVAAREAELVIDCDRTVRADRSRLQQLLENLLRNAVEHGGETVTITVGELDDGFYIEDDGSGIPQEIRDDLFKEGYSTSDEGTGFGLSIVEQVATAHGWSVAVTEGADGGARFEITSVEFCAE